MGSPSASATGSRQRTTPYDISANVRLADGDSVEQTLAETLSVIQRAGYAALHRPQNLKPPAQTVAEATEEAAKPARTRRTKEQIAARAIKVCRIAIMKFCDDAWTSLSEDCAS